MKHQSIHEPGPDASPAGAAAPVIERCSENPIVTPGAYPWRAAASFNPGVIYERNRFYMFERAAATLRPFDCCVGLLQSEDGVHFEHMQETPVLTAEQLGYPQGAIEDPRVVKIDNIYYMVFAFRPYAYHCYPTGTGVPDYEPIIGELDTGVNLTRSGLAASENMTDWTFLGFTTPDDVDDRDNVLFPDRVDGRFALLRRPREYVGREYGTDKPGIWLSYSEDLRHWDKPRFVAGPAETWEGGKIGAAGPPILTDRGWLMLYHGVDEYSVYRVGVMLLDADTPERVIARPPVPVMEPTEYYERFGLVIPNVVFPTANPVRDGMIHIYYGCTDTCIGLATVSLDELLDYVAQWSN